MVQKSRLAVLAVLLTLSVVGCGQGASPQPTTASGENRPLTSEDRLVEQRLVNDRDIRSAKAGSAQRAFLEYWAALAYEDWATAVRYLDRRLRQAFDPAHLIPALRVESQSNVPVKPVVRGVQRTRGSVTIRYMVRTSEGRLRPTSSAWEVRGGVWYMVYSSTLDDSYGAAVQQAVQNEEDPLAKRASREALRAGMRARRTQAQALRLAPTPTPSAATPRPSRQPAARTTPTAEPTEPETNGP